MDTGEHTDEHHVPVYMTFVTFPASAPHQAAFNQPHRALDKEVKRRAMSSA